MATQKHKGEILTSIERFMSADDCFFTTLKEKVRKLSFELAKLKVFKIKSSQPTNLRFFPRLTN